MTTGATSAPGLPRSLESIRAEFPILEREVKGKPLSYLDNGATVQKPAAVIEAVDRYYREHNANVHRGIHTLSEEATNIYEGARASVAAHIGAGPREVIFTRNVTAAINLVAQPWGRANLGPGDRILLTEMEHHSNIVPWYLIAERTGAELDWVGVDENGRLDQDQLEAGLAREPKMFAFSHVSNVLGTTNRAAELVNKAKAVGALTLIDGAQAAPKMALDMKAIGADFYGFTGHKFYGPTGIGVLYGRRELLEELEPFEGGGSMISKVAKDRITWASVPAKFEAGTPPIAEAAGLGAAVKWINGIGLDAIASHEHDLTAYALPRLQEVPGLKLFGPTDLEDREAILSFDLEGVHPHDVAEILDRHGVAVRAGHHCAQVLMKRLNVPATTRASYAVYNTNEETDRLIKALHDARRVFGL
ncbi:MAG: SufS family cysteine desulfurase [Solirubrobacterales bacterium]|nr:SufS family cysteine desulfurase [Solirubrobacterales bacterium]